MKKILISFIIATLSLSLLISCSEEKKTPTTNAPVEQTPAENTEGSPSDYDSRFDNTVEDAVACYYSLMTEDGYENYLLAFPEEYIEGHKALIEYTDELWAEAIKTDTEKVYANRDEKYGYAEFHIEYKQVETIELSEEEKTTIINDLVDFCYMSASDIEQIVSYKYLVHTYGVDTSTGDIVCDEELGETLTLLYLKERGWYVSPTNCQFP